MKVATAIYCGELSFCARCEKCLCKQFIKGVENWFLPMSYQQKLAFFLGLLKRCNTIFIGNLLSSIKVSEGKEKIYRFSKTNPQLDDMNEPPLCAVGPGAHDLNLQIMSAFLEFLTFSEYQKKMVFLYFFKLSEDRLLANLSSQMYNIILRDGLPEHLSTPESSSDVETTAAGDKNEKSTEQLAVDDVALKKEEKEVVNLDDVHNAEPTSNYESEDDGFAFDSDSDSTTTTIRPGSSVRTRPKSSAKEKKKKQTANMSIFNEKGGKDFISALPVGIAKKIFGYLDKVSIANCLCVSSVWRQLSEEVRTELQVQSEVTASVKLMQRIMLDEKVAQSAQPPCSFIDVEFLEGSTGRLCNHRYARFVDVLVPNFDIETGGVIPDPRPLQVDENSHIYVNAFSGVSTRKVIMEERNVYCGPFNVMVVCDQSDKHRIIHNDGGNFISIGSRNRKITLHDIATVQELQKVLEGHSGSVRCIRISTSDNLVFSGSYDTGVRVWDLNTGKFTKVFNGHQATVLCLAYENQLIVSGSVDRTCRVWSLKSLKCVRKFYHRSAVTAVGIRTAYMEERVVSGDLKGHLKVWNLRTGHLIKVLHGHSGEITSIDMDRWFILSGSKDHYMMGWSNQGDHKRCLFAFAHPNHVLSVSLRYLRAISGCGDGRIRIWSILNGNCVKVLRGNSRNDPIISLDCRENMLTINTESNVIVMKYEPIRFNYTTSELYLPESSLKLKNATATSALSDSELDHIDSNGEPLCGRTSRPHSAVRATRMHILQRASRDISGSRSSVRSISPGASSFTRGRSASPDSLPRRAVSSISRFARKHRIPSATSSKLRPYSSTSWHRSRRSAELEQAIFVQNPNTITSMLDHRCYPLRHRDLEAARRIQYAATLPPWRKDEAEDILKEVRDEHKRLVDKRRSLREQRAEQKRLAELAVTADETQADEEESETNEPAKTPAATKAADDDKNMIRRMTWSFHRSHLPLTSAYSKGSSGADTEEDDSGKPIVRPAPQPPSLDAAQQDLRKALIPGADLPASPFVRVSVSEVMRQSKEDVTTKPPLRVLPMAGGQRHNSLSNADKANILPPAKERRPTKLNKNQETPRRDISSAQKLRKILLEHQKGNELAARGKRASSARAQQQKEETMSPAELLASENSRLLEMAAEIEKGGWNEGAVVKETFKNPVNVLVKPSPVPQTIFQDSVCTSIPKPFEILTAKPPQRPASAFVSRPRSGISAAKAPFAETLMTSSKMSPEPLMKVRNFDNLLENVHQKVEWIKNEQAKDAQRNATSKLDYRLKEKDLLVKPPVAESGRPKTAPVSSLLLMGGVFNGPKPLVLHNPDIYDRQAAELVELNEQEILRKKKRLETWRRKRWALLAAGKLTPKQLHEVKK